MERIIILSEAQARLLKDRLNITDELIDAALRDDVGKIGENIYITKPLNV